MKGGKDDEKIMGPMFPRLHVNDTDKGGPRAPPRNKMALYEQLSIPTQRFNLAVLPQNSSNTSTLVPPGSSSQGSGLERNFLFTHAVPPSTPSHLADNFHSCPPAGATSNTPLPHHELRKNVGDEDDFAVPVFVQSGTGQYQGKSQNDIDMGNFSPFKPTCTGHSTKFQNVCDMNPKQSSSSGVSLRQEAMHRISSRDDPVKSSVNLSTREKIDGFVKEVSESPNQECGDIPRSKFSRLNNSNACLRLESRAGLPPNDYARGDGAESTRDIEKGVVSQPESDSHSREDLGNPNEFDNNRRYHGDKTCGPLQLVSGDKSDDVSETSMVDSISGLDISPDDVVGIIGHKHFWKARRAIVNREMDNPNRVMQGDPETADHFIYLCFLASYYWIYSCLGLVLLLFPAILRVYLSTALEGLEQEMKEQWRMIPGANFGWSLRNRRMFDSGKLLVDSVAKRMFQLVSWFCMLEDIVGCDS